MWTPKVLSPSRLAETFIFTNRLSVHTGNYFLYLSPKSGILTLQAANLISFWERHHMSDLLSEHIAVRAFPIHYPTVAAAPSQEELVLRDEIRRKVMGDSVPSGMAVAETAGEQDTSSCTSSSFSSEEFPTVWDHRLEISHH